MLLELGAFKVRDREPPYDGDAATGASLPGAKILIDSPIPQGSDFAQVPPPCRIVAPAAAQGASCRTARPGAGHVAEIFIGRRFPGLCVGSGGPSR